MKSFKYFSILLIPITVYISFTSKGWLTYTSLITLFGLLPSIEFFMKPDKKNFSKEEEKVEKENKTYTYILYITLPIQIAFLVYFFGAIQEAGLSSSELIGRISAMGVMCSTIGINIGHEMGHRNNRFDQLIGEILLLTSINTHFLPYHNAGHHFNVATPNDAATARKNEWVYTFWFRSHFSSYVQAWQLENKRLKDSERNWFHIQNRMIIYTIATFSLLTSIYFLFGQFALLCFLAAAIFGILQLETVNYIEHYGLLRTQNEHGRHERVKRTHSWNSDHVLGKLILFNLSRHSDHHYNGSKQYQLLKTLPESPQMPTGYPGMMIFSLFSPLWFLFMNKKLKTLQ